MSKVGLYKISKNVSNTLNNNISESQLQDYFQIILDQVKEMMLDDQCFNIDNFGIFCPSFTKAKEVNFLNKEIKTIAEQKTIKFIPHQNLLKKIKRRKEKLDTQLH
jgi:nucleoid DNA-binding protein